MGLIFGSRLQAYGPALLPPPPENEDEEGKMSPNSKPLCSAALASFRDHKVRWGGGFSFAMGTPVPLCAQHAAACELGAAVQ